RYLGDVHAPAVSLKKSCADFCGEKQVIPKRSGAPSPQTLDPPTPSTQASGERDSGRAVQAKLAARDLTTPIPAFEQLLHHVVMPAAARLPIGPIPHQRVITPMGMDMINCC
ncbi:MAG TPA: hypothetical protein VGN75_02765, partial [Kaistia sp.]|nr:hypothetical protein [Kaistia sp.]